MATFKLQVASAKVSGTHSDFPAYVDLSEMPTAFWDTVSNGGGDIRCYSNEALTTELPREVVSCDTSTDTGELWVKTGMSTTTEIYITVDGTNTEPTASSTYGSENVWNSNYKAVYHLEDANDSTSNDNDGTVDGATSGATGKIGKAYDFDGTNDRITTAANSSLSPSTYSLGVWVYATGFPGTDANVYISNGTYPNQKFQFRHAQSTKYLMLGYGNGSSFTSFSTTQVIPLNTWVRCIATWDGDKIRIYYNGSLIGTSGSLTAPASTTDNIVNLGAERGGSNYFQGRLDEIFIYSGVLSTDYITTEYNNQSDASTFWSIEDVTPTGTKIKRWDGTAWQEHNLKRYNGSEWEDVTIKRYNGSSWDEL